MRRQVFALVLAFGICAATSAFAQTAPKRSQADIEKMVDALLNSIEYVPTKKDWDRIGPRAAVVLRTIASNISELATKRGRAVSSLVYFPSKQTRDYLINTVNDPKNPGIVRGKSARALALTSKNAALPVLTPLIAHPNKRMCESFIKATALIETNEAREVLQKRLKKESRAYIKTVLTGAIRRIDRKQRR